jgi:hypothetical protein
MDRAGGRTGTGHRGRHAKLFRRVGEPRWVPVDGITIYSRDREDDFVTAFPTLGKLAPLNMALSR